MSFLLDTNVVSESRKGPRAAANVTAWFELVPDDELFLSVLVLGEIRQGIELVRRRDRASAQNLERWLRGIRTSYSDRVLPVTWDITDLWGRLAALRSIPVVDALMAATAMVHDLTLVTRNVEDVAGTGVDVLNPFATR